MAQIDKVDLDTDLDVIKRVAQIVKDVVTMAMDAYSGDGFGLLGAVVDLLGQVFQDNRVSDKLNEVIVAFNRLATLVMDELKLIDRKLLDDVTKDVKNAWDEYSGDPGPRHNADGTINVDYGLRLAAECENTLSALVRADDQYGDVDDPDPTMNAFWTISIGRGEEALYARMNMFGVGSDNPSEKPPPRGVADARLARFPFVAPKTPPAPNETGFPAILEPPPDTADRMVFNHLYVLPAFLQALARYQIIASSTLPDFPTRKKAMVLRYAKFLAKLHDKIAGQGISLLTPPTPGDIFSLYDPDFPPYLDRTNYDQSPVHLDANGNDLASGFWRAPFYQPFGALELYSGASALIPYSQIPFDPACFVNLAPGEVPPLPTQNQRVSQEWLNRFYAKLRIRALACAKVLYVRTGMGEIRGLVNALHELVGEPKRFEGISQGDWSLREVFTAVDDPIVPSSARALIGYLRSAPPSDPQSVEGLQATLMGDVVAKLSAS